MQIRVKEGRVYITRENYKGIKKYDRRQMEQALQAIYEKGKADGKPEVPEKVRIRQGVTLAADAVVHALEETKGSEQSAGKKYYSGSGTMRTKNGGDTMSGLMFPKIKTKKKRKSHAKASCRTKRTRGAIYACCSTGITVSREFKNTISVLAPRTTPKQKKWA